MPNGPWLRRPPPPPRPQRWKTGLEAEVRQLEERLTQAREELAAARLRARRAEAAERRASRPGRPGWSTSSRGPTPTPPPGWPTSRPNCGRPSRPGTGGGLRELSAERGSLLDGLVAQALAAAGTPDPPPTLRAEVTDTLTAALADPATAADFATGTLTKAAQWGGFGYAGFGVADGSAADGPSSAALAPTALASTTRPNATGRHRTARQRTAAPAPPPVAAGRPAVVSHPGPDPSSQAGRSGQAGRAQRPGQACRLGRHFTRGKARGTRAAGTRATGTARATAAGRGRAAAGAGGCRARRPRPGEVGGCRTVPGPGLDRRRRGCSRGGPTRGRGPPARRPHHPGAGRTGHRPAPRPPSRRSRAPCSPGPGPAPVTTFVRSADGRQLAVKMSGNPTGHPVFMLHGTPGSRVGPFPRSRVLYELGVRLISFDRPGYGASDRLDSRRVADVVPDVVAIADTLEVNTFAVLGRSGGGPHALACAALLPDRVTRASVLVSLAPWAAEGLDWFAGINEPNVREYTAAASEPELLTARLIETAAQIKANPAAHVDGLRPEMPGLGPAGRVRYRDPRLAGAELRRGATRLRRRLDRRRACLLRALGFQPGRHPGSGAALARPRTTCSRRWRTRAGWRTRSRTRSCRSGRTPLTSRPSRCCRTCCPG